MYMAIDNSTFDSSIYSLMKKSLNASSLRSKVIANNIANINTAGYKAYKVSFEDTLKNSQNQLELITDNSRDITENTDNSEIKVEQDNSASMRTDGNNVDVNNEMVNQAANTLEFNALVTQINNRLSNTRYVINGGK